jgi:hypothetical protein
MRKALNENPTVQIAVVGVLILVVGLFFMMSKKKGGSESSSSTAAPAATADASGAAGTAAPVTGSSGAAGSAPVAAPSTSVSVTSGTVTPDALIPGRGLPKKVVDAWQSGDAIVLLIVRGGGIDDRLVRASVQSLSGDSGTSVFVSRAKDVYRYSRITQGVGVSRAPALVVVRPKDVSGSVPQAQVSYGFRDSQSVVQAVHDALYKGRDNLPYSPR